MGLENRDYLRDEARRYGDGGGGGFGVRPSFSDQWAIKVIIMINVVVWLLQLVTAKPGDRRGGRNHFVALSLAQRSRLLSNLAFTLVWILSRG